MRPGGNTLQHVLTPEAAGLVKQAVGLAHRRGHAQVTPLHVANTMLSSSSSSAGLLRSACLHSHSHPLQCKALELCLNVALNRLPSSSSSTSSLSNALVAAFKRAQAHQRRGSVEAHQKPIDVGQLVVSILNDPSVSRVMREAGFSSTQVKANVEIMNPNYKTTSTTTTTNTSFPSMGYHFGHQPSRSDMRCRVGITIPACSLELSLNSHDCDLGQGQLNHKRSMDGSDWSLIKSGELTCCGDCSAKLDVEIRSNHGSTTSSPTTTSSFPSWLYKQENSTKLSTTNHDQDHLQYVRDLFKKWNSICNSLHKNHHKTLNFSLMTSPSTSTTSSHDHIHQDKDPIIRSPSIDKEGHHLQRFKEFNTENLKSLSNSLERVVPWQSELAPEIAGAVLQCRSGMMRRRAKSRSGGAKEDTWLLFQGGDVEGKEKVCRELARVVFSSRAKLTSIRMSSIFATRADSMEDMKNKRTRYDKSSALLERFVEAVRFDPHRVFMVEDVEQLDYSWWLNLKRSIEGGKVCDSNGEEVSFGDAIIVLSCESFDSSSRACSLALKQKRDQVEEEMVEGEVGSFDLNLVVKDHGDEGFAFDGGVGLVEVVDRCFFFKLKEDLQD